MAFNDQAIGVFDSGVGGLTVLRALVTILGNSLVFVGLFDLLGGGDVA
jgi:glutamate racemase